MFDSAVVAFVVVIEMFGWVAVAGDRTLVAVGLAPGPPSLVACPFLPRVPPSGGGLRLKNDR